MDLDRLDVAEAADKGASLRLRHPVTNELGDAKLILRGVESEIVVNAGRASDKSFLEQKDADLAEALSARKIAMAKATIKKVEGLTDNGEEVDADRLKTLLDRPGYSWIVDQIIEFAGQRANFFPKP